MTVPSEHQLIMEKNRTLLLKTKFYTPMPRPNLVSRPRLMERLEESLRLQHRLTLISAKAGSGKTTLVSEWLHQQERSFAWLSLDVNDNDPRRYFSYLTEALRQIDITISHTELDEVEILTIPLAEVLVTELINDIATSSIPFILVLDDFHVIQNDWILKAIEFLIMHQPPGMHLIILTRVDSQLSLSQLRGRGQLTEIRDGDLRFTDSEVDAFLNEVMKLDLPREAVATIGQRTEGWIAGVLMAAISAQGHKQNQDLGAFVEKFGGTNRFILDYLMEEVLNQQSPVLQDFLIETSILDCMCGNLCDAIYFGGTKTPDSSEETFKPGEKGNSQGGSSELEAHLAEAPVTRSQGILEQLERMNLFVISLDDERQWYRYHHLFADLLQSVLRVRRSKEQIRELHRRASRWYQAEGALDEAMRHTLAAQDFDRAAAIIDENIDRLFNRNNPEILLGWIKNLPKEILENRPWMDVYYANTLTFLGQLDEVDALLQSAEQRIKSGDPRRAEILGHITAVRAFAANLRGNWTDAVQMATLSKKYLPEGKPGFGGMIAYILADAYLAGDDMQSATREITDLLKTGEKTGQVLMMVTALCNLAVVKKVQGRLHQADEVYNQAFQCMVTQNGLGLRVRCAYEFGLADLLREWNQLDAALELAMTATERLHRLGGYLVDGDLALMRIFQARGEVENATKSLHEAEKHVEIYRFPLTTMIEFHTARVEQWLAIGDVETASRWARECNGGSEKEQITLARLCLAQGHPAEAQCLLDNQQPLAEAGERYGRLIEILALQAIALNDQGLLAKAGAALSRALSLAQPEGYLRMFLDLGQPLRAVQDRLSLLERSDLATQNERAETVSRTTTFAEAQNEALTGRELEVLRLLAEGLTNKEMATRLVVAPSTIKQHLKAVYRKLDVYNRTQAVARGRVLNLL